MPVGVASPPSPAATVTGTRSDDGVPIARKQLTSGPRQQSRGTRQMSCL